MYHDFLGPRGLQGTHMDTLKPKNSKSITFTVRGGFFTFWAILAHSAAPCPASCPAPGLAPGSAPGPAPSPAPKKVYPGFELQTVGITRWHATYYSTEVSTSD